MQTLLDGRVAKRGECTHEEVPWKGASTLGTESVRLYSVRLEPRIPPALDLQFAEYESIGIIPDYTFRREELSLQRRHSLTLDQTRDDPVMAEPTLPAEAPLLASLPALPPLGGAPPTPAPAPVPAPTSTPTGKGRGRGGAGKGAARKADDAPDGEPKPKRSRKRPADGTGPG